jgi:hypothetical protein
MLQGGGRSKTPGVVKVAMLTCALYAVLTPVHMPGSRMPAASASDGTPVEKAFPQGLTEGAVAVDEDTVSFADGTIVLELGPAAFDDCPSGWVCLWEHADFGGRMLQFSQCDVNGDGTCDWQNLTAYNFNDQMSSWRNRKSVDAHWAYATNGGGTRRCMESQSSSNWVGAVDNDEASSLIIRKNDGWC